MNFLDIFKKNDVSNLTGILSEPDDMWLRYRKTKDRKGQALLTNC